MREKQWLWLGIEWTSSYDVGGFRVRIGYEVEVEAVDKGPRTSSAAQGGVHETGV